MGLLLLSISLALWQPQAETRLASRSDVVDEIQIRGNRRIPTDTIRFNLQTKPGSPLDRQVVRRGRQDAL